jgi:hypothetical protein
MKFHTPIICILLSICCMIPFSLDAQRYKKRINNRFKAGITIGLNVSQVDGDQYTGFNKINTSFGLAGTAILTRQMEVGVELLYIGKGCRTETKVAFRDRKNREVDLTYMEVPFLFRYRFMSELPHTFLETGFSFARMINSRIKEPTAPADGYIFADLEDSFERNEFNLLIGAGGQLSEHFSVKIRYSIAMSRFYNADTPAQQVSSPIGYIRERRIEFLRNYLLMISMQYDF